MIVQSRVLVSLKSKANNFNFAIQKSSTLSELRNQILNRSNIHGIDYISFRTLNGINISSQTIFRDLKCFDAITLNFHF